MERPPFGGLFYLQQANFPPVLDKLPGFAIIVRYLVRERAGIGRQASLRCLCP